VKVTAVSPGYRATELNGGLPTPGAGDPAGGAAVAVTMARMDEDGPTGEFHSDAHYSTIHTPPAHVPTALAEFARVITPGGYLLLAFQSGDTLDGWEAFDHKVSPAYRWAIDTFAELLRAAGLIEIARLRVQPRSTERFPTGVLLARKFATAN
jgi:hypothetical protein